MTVSGLTTMRVLRQFGRGEQVLPTRAGPIPEAGHAFACCAGEGPAGVGVPGSQTRARRVFGASRATRRAAISGRHTWLMTVSAPSRKHNIFNYYGVFSRQRPSVY